MIDAKPTTYAPLPKRKGVVPADLRGKRFAELRVVEFAGYSTGLKPHILWQCLCSCGKTVTINSRNLRENVTTSCGCTYINGMKLPPGEASFGCLYSGYRRGAQIRGLAFKLSKSAFRQLVIGNCHYCGVPPTQVYNGRNKITNGPFTYNGVDRADNNRGYTDDNVRTCCKICNRAKHVLTETDFLTWVRKIYNWSCK